MDISSATNAFFPRYITPVKNSSDRQPAKGEVSELAAEKEISEQSQQAITAQQNDNAKPQSQNRLDGRLINFARQQDDTVTHNQKNTSHIELTRYQQQQNMNSDERDVIHIVV